MHRVNDQIGSAESSANAADHPRLRAVRVHEQPSLRARGLEPAHEPRHLAYSAEIGQRRHGSTEPWQWMQRHAREVLGGVVQQATRAKGQVALTGAEARVCDFVQCRQLGSAELELGYDVDDAHDGVSLVS